MCVSPGENEKNSYFVFGNGDFDNDVYLNIEKRCLRERIHGMSQSFLIKEHKWGAPIKKYVFIWALPQQRLDPHFFQAV